MHYCFHFTQKWTSDGGYLCLHIGGWGRGKNKKKKHLKKKLSKILCHTVFNTHLMKLYRLQMTWKYHPMQYLLGNFYPQMLPSQSKTHMYIENHGRKSTKKNNFWKVLSHIIFIWGISVGLESYNLAVFFIQTMVQNFSTLLLLHLIQNLAKMVGKTLT